MQMDVTGEIHSVTGEAHSVCLVLARFAAPWFTCNANQVHTVFVFDDRI